MNTKTIKIVLILLIATVVLIFSGKHLLLINDVETLFDGLMVMFFFISLFPFLSLLSVVLNKIFRVFSHAKNY